VSKITAVSLILTGLAYFACRRGWIGRARWAFAAPGGPQTAILTGLAVLVLRAVLLPFWPIPKPVIYDEFSYLLAADTFAHGRLTNPPHPLWPFFETIYVLQQPTYSSKYPPGQGLVMAAGQVVLGHPWFGVWLSCGALAAALCWAIQGWFSPGWARLGALIVFCPCVFSYWMNSYWGGAVAGIGGALAMGAWIRITRRRALGFAWVYGVGAVLLMLTRPYEGLLLMAPATLALFMREKSARVWLPIGVLAAGGLAWQGYFDYRVTGRPLRMPYQAYFEQYESMPPLTILPVQPQKTYRHFDLEFLASGWTRAANAKAHSRELVAMRAGELVRAAHTMLGGPVWVGLMLAWAPVWVVSRRLRLPVVLLGFLIAGAVIEMTFYDHYAAPFMAVLLILTIESLRRMRVWLALHLPGRQAAGRLVIFVLAGSLAGGELVSGAIHVYSHTTGDQVQPVNPGREAMEKKLTESGAEDHVIFVRYTGRQSPHEEWIYNPADIDRAPVIWAQDMGAENRKLMEYYKGRSFWLFEPDRDASALTPYSGP
jgi:hypothetical protein